MMKRFLPLGILISILTGALPIQAQIQSDQTLTGANSIVVPSVIKGLQSDLITGGTQNGSNLFHSFSQFNIEASRGAYFANPTGITNILTRVTGGNRSNLDGTLGVLGNANLFFLNPYGIVFGSGAKLDLAGGSFTASTAGSIALGSQGRFNAINPEQSHLLDVNPNVYFAQAAGQVNPIRPIGDLTQSGNLTVNPGQNLSLFGSTVYQMGTLTAPGGTVAVLGDRVGLMAGSKIDVSAPGQAGSVLIGGDLNGLGTVPLAQVTYVDPNAVVNANAIGLDHPSGNGGQIAIWGTETLRAYGSINAKGIGSGKGGFVETSSRGFVDIAGVQVNVQAPGTAGTWLIDPHNITIVDGNAPLLNPLLGGIFTASTDDTIIYVSHLKSVLNAGNNVTIETGTTGSQVGNITASGFGLDVTNTLPVTLTLRAANDINLSSFGINAKAAPMNLVLQAGHDVTLTSGSISTAGGNLNLTAANNIGVNGGGFGTISAPILFKAQQNIAIDGAGFDAGNSSVTLIADEARSRQGSINLSKSGIAATGGITLSAAGNLTISVAGINSVNTSVNAAAPIRLSARDISIAETGINTASQTTGRGSDIIVNADQFAIRVGSLDSKTTGAGRAGDILVTANQVKLEAFSLTNWTIGSGRGGDVLINAKDIKLDKAGSVSTKSGAYWNGNSTIVVPGTTGNAGNLTFRAETIDMAGSSSVGSETQALGSAGTVLFEAKTVKIGGKSQVSNVTQSSGNAGTLTIAATDSIEVNNGNVQTASYGSGSGGTLNLTTDRLSLISGGLQSSTFKSGQGGGMTVQANVLNGDGGYILGAASGSGNAGDTVIKVDMLNFKNNAIISNTTNGSGNAGKINITGREINLLDRSVVNTETTQTATGQAADIRIQADRLTLGTQGFIGNSSRGAGAAGLIDLQIKDLAVKGGIIASSTEKSGTSGTVNLQSDRITLDRAVLETRTAGSAKGGLLQINVSDRLTLTNNTTLSARAEITATGNAGMVKITAPNIDLFSQSRIEGTTLGTGRGGVVDIEAGTLNLAQNSQIQSFTNGFGDGGNVKVNADRINLTGKSEIISNSLKIDSGNAGAIGVTANVLSLDDSRIATNTSGSAMGGEILITTGQTKLDRGSVISSFGSNTGAAGSVKVITDRLKLNDRSRIDLRTASGQGGNLDLVANFIELRLGSVISAESQGPGTGGNIKIDSPVMVGFENSDIIAKANQPKGGNLQIKTNSLFGLQVRDRLTEDNDITASSQVRLTGALMSPPTIEEQARVMSLPQDRINAGQVIDRCSVAEKGQTPPIVEANMMTRDATGAIVLGVMRSATLPTSVTCAIEKSGPD